MLVLAHLSPSMTLMNHLEKHKASRVVLPYPSLVLKITAVEVL